MRRLTGFRPHTSDETEFIVGINRGMRSLPAHSTLKKAGSTGAEFYTLTEGWAARYSNIAGHARHLTDILLPGDMVGLHSSLIGGGIHSVESLTPIRCCVLDGASLRELFSKHADLGFALMRLYSEEKQRSDRRAALLAGASATERLAYFFVETLERLRARGLAGHDGTICPFPLRINDLAELAGLSRVHVSRTIGEFRRQGLIHLAPNLLMLSDEAALQKIAGARPIPMPQQPFI